MRSNHVNRLERHWPEPSVPVVYPESEFANRERLSASSIWDRECQSFMGSHPKLTVAAAAAVGLVLGWMAKRK